MNNQKIITFLTFNDKAEEAVNFYCSIFKDSEIISTSRYPDNFPGMGGKFMTAEFKLNGQRFHALNGGPHFTFTEGISLFVNCETQQEIDDLWNRLSAGGEPGQCGWLRDKFGVSWQIVPAGLGKLLHQKDPAKAKKVMDAMMKMKKMDIEVLENAAL
jgi:predicted 3-demethylubiquinone-9 3-methyltransferase (glyoxalase superfamily)